MISESAIINASVLIVDDHKPSLDELERILQGAGYTAISSTTDPQEVCDLHRENSYDLILLDLQMAGGLQTLEDLTKAEISGYLPVLAVTSEPAERLHALQAGAKDFVSKPFDQAEVLLRVHNMLEVSLLREAARHYSETLEFLALQDPLTGLANRRLIAERMRMALAHGQKNKSAMAVIYLDLDGFKEINDTLGHGTGDTLLKMVAERLVGGVRDEDTVARLGGDEFMIALWHVISAHDAGLVASKVIEKVAQPFIIGGHAVSVTTSAGVAIYPVHGEDTDTLMQSADLALYEAKRAGKNVYRISERTERISTTRLHPRTEQSLPIPGIIESAV
ncbi:MAG: diguanylate cyclase domain-containing protein [Gemmatimonadaceae bacterium]